MAKTDIKQAEKDTPSHNLLGQRLGRKGRDTRERILAATERLLSGPPDTAISLSAVAREASLGMTTLYLYFSDLTELLLAVLEPIMASAEESYVAHLRNRWPDDELGEHCRRFVLAFHSFWEKHARILHLRNSLADGNDERMQQCRINSAEPLIQLLARQMDHEPTSIRTPAISLATVLFASIERMVTVATDETFMKMMQDDERAPHIRNLMLAESRLLELGIRDGREMAKAN